MRYRVNIAGIIYVAVILVVSESCMAIDNKQSKQDIAQTVTQPEVQMAQKLQKEGKASKALLHWEAAAKLQPDNIELTKQLGMMYIVAKKYEPAKKIFERIISSQELLIVKQEAIAQLIKIAKEEKSLDKFISDAETGIAKEPENDGNYRKLIEVYISTGKTRMAEDMLKKAVKKFPSNPQFKVMLEGVKKR
ncbi:MAG: hypothetical protein NTX47_00150 [Candidatus Omnitrophica bacterium]|nr:hypothetical protein [Candidatus Omnitrophota bacterium]